MSNSSKKFLKGWNAFEICLLVGGWISMIVVGIIFHSWWLTIFTSVLNLFCCVLSAKGKVIASIIGLVCIVVYSILSYYNSYYGEIIISMCIMLPLYVWQIYVWIKHRDKKENLVLVNSIGAKEWACVGTIAAVVFVGFFFILRALNTANLVVSTISIIGNLMGMYLLIRRSKYGFATYLVDDVVFFILWLIPTIQGNLSLLPIVINPLLNIVSDIYGLVNWGKLQKKQKSEVKEIADGN